MTRLFLPPMASFLLLSAFLLTPCPAQGQEGQPYTLDQIEGLVEAGLSTSVILEMVRPDCLAFRIDQDAEDRLTAAGGNSDLIEGLKTICYRGPEPEVQAPPEAAAATPPPSAPLSFNPGSAALRSPSNGAGNKISRDPNPGQSIGEMFAGTKRIRGERERPRRAERRATTAPSGAGASVVSVRSRRR